MSTCPFCNEPMTYRVIGCTGYRCGTQIHTSSHARDHQTRPCAQTERQRLHVMLCRLNLIADAAELFAEVAASPWEAAETKAERLRKLNDALAERGKEIKL